MPILPSSLNPRIIVKIRAAAATDSVHTLFLTVLPSLRGPIPVFPPILLHLTTVPLTLNLPTPTSLRTTTATATMLVSVAQTASLLRSTASAPPIPPRLPSSPARHSQTSPSHSQPAAISSSDRPPTLECLLAQTTPSPARRLLHRCQAFHRPLMPTIVGKKMQAERPSSAHHASFSTPSMRLAPTTISTIYPLSTAAPISADEDLSTVPMVPSPVQMLVPSDRDQSLGSNPKAMPLALTLPLTLLVPLPWDALTVATSV